MSHGSGRVEGEGGNREVPPRLILPRVPGDMRGRRASVYSDKEGGSWERYASWTDTQEPEAEEAA
jgi:hypothetical protein